MPSEETITEERSANVARSKKVSDRLKEIYKSIEKGFEDQTARARMIGEYWDCYNCILGSRQNYSGDNTVYIPSVYQAVSARVTRFTNQIFPFNGRHIEAISTDAITPRARTALAEHYIRKSTFKSFVKQFLVNRDVEGHGWIYTYWCERKRFVVDRKKKDVEVDRAPVGEVTEAKEDVVHDSYPCVTVIPDTDVLVIPATADTLDEALDEGGSVTILRRWSEEKIKSLIKSGFISAKEGNELIDKMSSHPYTAASIADRAKQSLNAAGIKGSGRGKHALVYQTWAKLDLPEGKRICEIFYASSDLILHAHRNPLWSDRLPLIGRAAIKIPGSHKGKSPISTVDTLQYFMNDIANLGADSAARGMVPIILTDPNANPRFDTMKLAQGAVWLADPRVTQILQFPELWKNSAELMNHVNGLIMTTLGVNPSMITQFSRPVKPTQAQVSQEHAVDLLTTATEVSDVEDTLSEWITLVMDMDKQYRDEEIQVQAFGEMGMAAIMEEIPPIAEDNKYAYLWYGVEQVRNEQRMQTQMGLLNVVKAIPPQMYQGYMVDISPALVAAFDSAFGPRVGRLVFKDIRSPLSMNPDAENKMMDEGHDVAVHPLDPHQEHMASHAKSIQESGDRTGLKSKHLFKHYIASASAMRAQQEAVGPQNPPGPRTGAKPSRGRPAQRPAGSIHRDQLAAQSQSMPRPAPRGNGGMR